MNDKLPKTYSHKELEKTCSPQNNGVLINQKIVQILVENNNPEEIKDLMAADLDYNRQRLQILREHADLHPDAIEDRKISRFRRVQYTFLMAFLPCVLVTTVFVPVSVAVVLSTIMAIITCGIVLNGRDRDGDSEALVKLIERLPGDKS